MPIYLVRLSPGVIEAWTTKYVVGVIDLLRSLKLDRPDLPNGSTDRQRDAEQEEKACGCCGGALVHSAPLQAWIC